MDSQPSRWRRRLALALLALSLGACATHPLGADWEKLDGSARTARSLNVLEGLIAGGVDGTGRTFSDREVLSVDRHGIRYVAEDDLHARASRLLWRAIKSVESETLASPSRPETLRVHLDGSFVGAVLDRVTPALAHTGLASPYLLLPSRPRWSRSRMVLALAHLRSSAAPLFSGSDASPIASQSRLSGPVVDRPPSVVGPSQKESLDAVEQKLERLKSWRARDLITEEDYEAKRRALLAGL
ncbi:MAG: hypothetical protein JKY65_31435 [Planctomycetes bacterium]|nr:hypothetical protein [Planctomycetota bacterium]